MASSLHHAHAALSVGSLTLHLLADLDVDIEELGDTAVEADGLALVEVTLAVVDGDALAGAGLSEAAISIISMGLRSLISRERPEEMARIYRCKLLGLNGHSPVEHVRDHLDFGLSGSKLLLRGHLGLATEKERHFELWIERCMWD